MPAGACKADISAFCKDTSAGDGRLAACLSERLNQAKKGNVAGRTVSDKCEEEVIQFKMERVTHINKDVPLGEQPAAAPGGLGCRSPQGPAHRAAAGQLFRGCTPHDQARCGSPSTLCVALQRAPARMTLASCAQRCQTPKTRAVSLPASGDSWASQHAVLR